jgi:hypothetical protein
MQLLMRRSSGDGDASEQATLTSMSHGLSASSSRMSNPKTSKHEGRPAWFIFETTECSTEMRVLTQMSWILRWIARTSTPALLMCFHSAVSDHLEPSSSRASSSLCSNSAFRLLTE